MLHTQKKNSEHWNLQTSIDPRRYLQQKSAKKNQGGSKMLLKIQSNLYITPLYIEVTLYMTVTGQLPEIFSCLTFSAKFTCI